MTLNEYQQQAMTTRLPGTYDEGKKIIYPTLGLTGESGEVSDKVKKVLRDNGGDFNDEQRVAIAKELGDVMWYVAALAKDLDYSLDEICAMNLKKLSDRKNRNKLHGNGDDR